MENMTPAPATQPAAQPSTVPVTAPAITPTVPSPAPAPAAPESPKSPLVDKLMSMPSQDSDIYLRGGPGGITVEEFAELSKLDQQTLQAGQGDPFSQLLGIAAGSVLGPLGKKIVG